MVPESRQPVYVKSKIPMGMPQTGYHEERKRLRFFANMFGVCVLLYFLTNQLVGALIDFLLELFYSPSLRLVFGMWETTYYLSAMAVYIVSFLLAFGLYAVFIKIPLRVAVPFRRVSPSTVLLTIPVTFGLSFLGAILTTIVSMVVEMTGYRPVSGQIALPTTALGHVLFFILLVILPAFLEEIAFRGVLMQSLRRFGDGFALLVSSVFFGLFHLNLVQAPYAFFLGLWFGLLVLRSGSLVSSIVLHGCVNLSAALIQIFTQEMPEEALAAFSVSYMFVWTVLAIVSFAVLVARKKISFFLYPARSWMSTGQRVGLYFTSILLLVSLVPMGYYILQNLVRIV